MQGLACCVLPCGIFFSVGKSSFKLNTIALIIYRSSCYMSCIRVIIHISALMGVLYAAERCFHKQIIHVLSTFCLDYLCNFCSRNNPASSPRWPPARACGQSRHETTQSTMNTHTLSSQTDTHFRLNTASQEPWWKPLVDC